MKLTKIEKIRLFQQMTGWSVDKIRANKKQVNALLDDSGGGAADAITYDEQELTEEQQTQARANIGAASESDVNSKIGDLSELQTTNKNNLVSAINEASQGHIDDSVVEQAVSDWLDAHPEATTTVEDGSITEAKLESSLRNGIVESGKEITAVTKLSAETIDFTIDNSGYIKYADGTSGTSSISAYTNYIDVSKYSRIYFKRGGFTSSSVSSGMAFYDENKVYISGLPAATGQAAQKYLDDLCVKDVPENAKYARFTTFVDTTTYGSFEILGDIKGVAILKNSVDDLESYVLDKYIWVYPQNWLNRNGLTSGELKADGSTLSTSGRSYTDYIPVVPGDKVRLIRTDTHVTPYRRHITCFDEHKNIIAAAGSDSVNTNAFTIPDGVYFIRMTVDTSTVTDYPVVIAKNADDVNTVKWSEYFKPYQVLTEDFLTPESKAAVQKLVNKQLKTSDLLNTYACALPRGFRMTVGLAETWYREAMCTPQSTYPSVSAGQAYTYLEDKYVRFANGSALDSVNGFGWTHYDALMTIIENEKGSAGFGRPRKVVADNVSDCTMLVIGDSKTEQGYITQDLLDLFTERSHTLTLLGTRGTAPNNHEGRSGWSTADYYTASKGGVQNKFYNPNTQTFDFSYYMEQQQYTSPDFVVIELGVNDLYNGSSSDITPTYNRLKGMIDSVREYDANIKILLVIPTLPTSIQGNMTVDRRTYVNRIIRYNALVTNNVFNTYSASRVRVSYCHLVINPETDIRENDNVHPSPAGYMKMAKEILNQVNCWQNGA